MNAAKPARFPFSAVVGHDEAKLALLLAAIDPAIGGVLLRGQKGSAKTTLARGLAALLPGEAPFVDLPLGATEDRLIGTLDLGAVLTGDGRRFEPGLLAAAHGGVLYVDEVNLLPDHLVDVLLDVAVSGANRVEREGISHEHPARFVLIGSMNPEEGELRPQLLDRFGLAVDLTTSLEPRDRAEAVRRRLDFDADPAAVAQRHAPSERELGTRLARIALAKDYGKPIEYSGPVYESMEVSGGSARLTFKHLGGGLVAKDSSAGELKWFTAAGADGKFVPATAKIEGDSVVVSSPDVSEPKAVRYAWTAYPDGCNFYNAAGLPTAPFKTDRW